MQHSIGGRADRHLLISVIVGVVVSAGADWSQFRGPNSAGVSDEKGLPLKWSATENIVWRTPLPGPGASSPITVGDRVFVTCFTGAGEPQARKRRGKGKSADEKKADEKKPDETKADESKADQTKAQDKKDKPPLEVHLICVSRSDGKVIWDKSIAVHQPEQPYREFITEHGYASGTPASDGQTIYTFFGRTGVFAHDLEGNQLWRSDVGTKTHGFGTANSPVLFDDLVNRQRQCRIGQARRAGQEIGR
jgi:hypothetical protein